MACGIVRDGILQKNCDQKCPASTEIRAADPPAARDFSRAHGIQAVLAAGYLFVVFLVMHVMDSDLAIASIGASTFIVFTFPHTKSAHCRFLIGGYVIGGVFGIVFCKAVAYWERQVSFPFPPYILGCSLALLFTMLFMSALNYEHPPAAAFTIAVTTSATPVLAGLTSVGFICLLCLIRYLLRNRLVNL